MSRHNLLARSDVPAGFAWGALTVVLASLLTAWADPASGHFSHALAFAMAASWLLYAAFSRQTLSTHWLAIPLAVCTCWGVGQIAFRTTVYPFETWNAVMAWGARLALFSLAFATLRGRIRETMLTALVWFGAAMAVFGLLQWFTGTGKMFWVIPTGYNGEIMGPFLNRDQYAVFAELLLPIALLRALQTSKAYRFYAAASGLMIGSVIACGSRAGIALVAAELVIFVLAGIYRSRSVRQPGIAILFASVAVFTVACGWQYAWDRFHLADPMTYRREMLISSARMIAARPLTGFGLGTWPAVYPSFAVFDPPHEFMNHAHNDWAEWTADGGIVFTCAVLIIPIIALFLVRRSPWVLGVPVALTHALVDFPMQKPALALLAFLLLGAAARASYGRGE